MNLESSPNVRQAALMLHAMAPQDSAWLLQQLPPIQAVELQALLEELRTLGIPSDPRLLGELRRDEEMPVESDRRDKSDHVVGRAAIHDLPIESLMHELDSVRVEILIPILKSEPVVLLAFLLSLKQWSWVDPFLAALETHRRLSLRLQIDAHSSGSGLTSDQGTQLRTLLLRRVLHRYQEASGSVPMPLNSSPVRSSSLAQWWQQRLGFWASIFAPLKAYR